MSFFVFSESLTRRHHKRLTRSWCGCLRLQPDGMLQHVLPLSHFQLMDQLVLLECHVSHWVSGLVSVKMLRCVLNEKLLLHLMHGNADFADLDLIWKALLVLPVWWNHLAFLTVVENGLGVLLPVRRDHFGTFFFSFTRIGWAYRLFWRLKISQRCHYKYSTVFVDITSLILTALESQSEGSESMPQIQIIIRQVGIGTYFCFFHQIESIHEGLYYEQ